ncbi:hypothetical protein QB910_000093 [Dabrowskivirus KKP3916]|uniref:HTH cro/C1-type domain-containing protein n=1 Tax=Alicyclobacillus phage KKP_3916 TaxID=3040651 RepID=A0AAT9V804_9CAUD|nr:hypothetical protein QB910_000093 [Alicyclobacillus phage KKP 3916]
MMTLGERLKEARKGKRYTQVFVQNLTGINNKTLSAYEMGTVKPDIDALSVLSSLYEVSIDYLVKGVESDSTLNEIKLILLEAELKAEGVKLSDEDIFKLHSIISKSSCEQRNRE